MTIHVVFALLLFLGAGACSGKRSDSAQTTPSGIRYEIISDLPGYSFYRPQSMAVDSPYVFVADARDANIAVLDYDLNFLYTIGGRGEGPAETTGLRDITARQGVLLMVSGTPSKLVSYDYSGKLLDVFSTPMSRWADVAIAANGSYRLLYCSTRDSLLLDTYSSNGTLLGRESLQAYMREGPLTSQARIRDFDDTQCIVFQHWPRIVSRTPSASKDFWYPLEDINPYIERYYRARESRKREGLPGEIVYEMQGGFDQWDGLLLVPGPLYHLQVIDLKDGSLYPIDLDPLSRNIGETAGHGVYADLSVCGDDILMISEGASCIIRIPLEDVVRAWGRARPLSPVQAPGGT